jgi:hypothetical protein
VSSRSVEPYQYQPRTNAIKSQTHESCRAPPPKHFVLAVLERKVHSVLLDPRHCLQFITLKPGDVVCDHKAPREGEKCRRLEQEALADDVHFVWLHAAEFQSGVLRNASEGAHVEHLSVLVDVRVVGRVSRSQRSRAVQGAVDRVLNRARVQQLVFFRFVQWQFVVVEFDKGRTGEVFHATATWSVVCQRDGVFVLQGLQQKGCCGVVLPDAGFFHVININQTCFYCRSLCDVRRCKHIHNSHEHHCTLQRRQHPDLKFLKELRSLLFGGLVIQR